MKWRNEQMYHLRQKEPLTIEKQDKYFDEVVSKIFVNENPNQLLFSYLYNNECIGYGGIVHISWTDLNAEISFLMNTELENEQFETNWTIFLLLIEKLAFDHLKLHKLYTYAFDIRPKLYVVLEKSNYSEEARLKEHTFINGKYKDVIIHAKINKCPILL
jgi:RimJ/RimL family protein N-acetyltransferase